MTIEDLIRTIVRDELAKTQPKSSGHLSVADYAEHWNVSVSTVRLAIRENRLEVTRVGRAIRISPDAQIAAPVSDNTARARMVLMRGGKFR